VYLNIFDSIVVCGGARYFSVMSLKYVLLVCGGVAELIAPIYLVLTEKTSSGGFFFLLSSQ
jgi:hypothetical protein